MVVVHSLFVLSKGPCSRIFGQILKSPVSNFTAATRGIHLTATRESERRYSSKHEWVQVENQIGTVGISNFAQDALGEVVYVQLPEINTSIQKGQECGALESVKAASEIVAPISGKVTEVNPEVTKTPNLINASCYESGWLFKLKLSNVEEFNELMDEKQYADYIKAQAH